jgi:L-rhamnose mutarotase
MSELEKFNSDTAWDSIADNVTDEEVAKAESGGRYINRFEGVLTVKSARHIFSEKAKGDSKFHTFVVTFENDNGETFEYKNYYSFATPKYGEKGTMFFGIRLKSLFRSLGFDELHLSTSTPEKKALAIASQKKYLGGWSEDGSLPKWEGLKVRGRIGYQTGSLHLKKAGDLFQVVDADDKLHVFAEIKRFDDDKNDWAIEKDLTLQNPSKDAIKTVLANNGLKLSYPDLLTTTAIAGVNADILARFEPGGPVKPAGPTDAHSQVKAAEDDDSF